MHIRKHISNPTNRKLNLQCYRKEKKKKLYTVDLYTKGVRLAVFDPQYNTIEVKIQRGTAFLDRFQLKVRDILTGNTHISISYIYYIYIIYERTYSHTYTHRKGAHVPRWSRYLFSIYFGPFRPLADPEMWGWVGGWEDEVGRRRTIVGAKITRAALGRPPGRGEKSHTRTMAV